MGGNVFQQLKRAKLLTILGAAAFSAVLFAPAAQADTPALGYTQFAGCPTVEEDPQSLVCVRTDVTGGSFVMGSKTVPIEKTIPLIGGVDENLENFVYNSEGGLRPVQQKVPGGVVGLTGLDWLTDLLGVNALKLYATTELAGTPNVNVFEEPLELPIKVHLTNPGGLLGNNCYIGSDSNPISLNLITGTTSPPPPNTPIKGKGATFSFDESSLISYLKDGTFVDNSFAAPGAKGCVLNLGLIPLNLDSIVNLQAGLPSPAGKNTTVQDFDAELVESEVVYP